MRKRFFFFPIFSFVLGALMMPELKAASKFIDLRDEEVEYHTGCNLTYYKEYRPRKFDKNLWSFPLEACDPVPIHALGNLRLFFTSAVEGNCPRVGQAIMLPPESLIEIRAVRAKAGNNGHWAQVYFGYNPSNYKQIGKKQIYNAQILALQTKDTQHVDEGGVQLFSGARYLSNDLIGKEVKGHLENLSDWNWKSPVFINALQNLLPKEEGIVFSETYQMLTSTICYWTKDENKLKKIKYTK